MGEIGETYSGLSGKTKDDFGKGSAKYITYMNVFSNAIIDKNMVDLIEVDDKQNCVKKGDVLFTTSSETPQEVGMSSVCCDDVPNLYLNSFCFGYRPNIEIDLNFLAYVLRSSTIRDQMVLLAQGISRYNISKKGVMNIEISLPELAEQQAIGEFFKQLDDTIAFHQRTQKKYQNLKKSYLEKMFAKINYAWKQRKLGEVVEITMGQSPSSKNYTNNPNDWILIQGNADIENYRVKPRVWTTEITKIAEIGDIILSVRAPVGDVAKTDYKAVLGRGVASIRGNDFIFQLLGKMKSFGFWETLSTGSTFDSINSDVLKNATIFIPNETEQQAIGEFFKQLDDTIAFHQRELEKYQQLKQVLLDQLFV